MNKKHYYVSQKNIFTWMIALCLAASAVARILIIGLKGTDTSMFLWGQIILPVAAAILFVYIILCHGEERLYRTAIPVWMFAGYFALFITNPVFSKLIIALSWVALFFTGILYTIITAGKKGKPMYMFPMIIGLAVLSGFGHMSTDAGLHKNLIDSIPDALILLGLLLLIFAIRPHSEETYHPHWGDRYDGRRIKSLPAMTQIIPFIMVNRNGATNTFADSFELTEVEKYIHRKREEGLTSFGITHVLLASYVRALCRYPALNRFISGQKIYSRGDDIQFCMVIKKEMSVDAPDTVIKLHLCPGDTADDVYRKMNEEVQNVKTSSALDSTFDNTAQAFTMIPSLLLKFTIWMLKCLDYFGLLPRFIAEISPFHGSIFFTSMGSLGIPPVYHHLYDFGNLPIFVAFGIKRRVNEVQRDGSIKPKTYVDCKFTVDERITDGFYFAAFYKYFKRLFTHPDILDNPPEEILQDVE